MIDIDDGALYFGDVIHARLNPVRHRFQYSVFSLWLDIDRIAQTTAQLKLLAYNRFALFSFFDRDHGARDGSPLRAWVESSLRAAGIPAPAGPIRLLCFPRVLGHVFNPLSIYFCYDERNQLRATLYEVRNTFGEMHVYAIDANAAKDSAIIQTVGKSFYVSPLMQMDARYEFNLTPPTEAFALTIRESGPQGPLLMATHRATRKLLTDRALFQAFATHPLMTLKIICAIHFEALRLFLKGARYQPYRRHTGRFVDRGELTGKIERKHAA